jgi:hypothetical protein
LRISKWTFLPRTCQNKKKKNKKGEKRRKKAEADNPSMLVLGRPTVGHDI